MSGTATGRAARSRGNDKIDHGSFDRLRGQRLPYAIFFGYFLAWQQESNIGRFVKCLYIDQVKRSQASTLYVKTLPVTLGHREGLRLV